MKALPLFMFSALTSLVMSTAQAATSTYVGTLNGETLSIKVDTQVPSTITKTETGPIYDPERGHDVPGTTTITSLIGAATFKLGAEEKTTPIYANGSEKVSGIAFSYYTAFKASEFAGLTFEGPLFTPQTAATSVNAAEDKITALELPNELSLRWYHQGTTKNGTVVLFKQ